MDSIRFWKRKLLYVWNNNIYVELIKYLIQLPSSPRTKYIYTHV